MSVLDILKQFTNINFDLVLIDDYTGEIIFSDAAREIKYEPERFLPVVAMEPPRRAGEVILHVDADDEEPFPYD